MRSRTSSSSSINVSKTGIGLVTCSLTLLICLLGLLSLLLFRPVDIFSRIPLYVLGTSISFVASIIYLDGITTISTKTGLESIKKSLIISILTFIFLLLLGEGLIYILVSPDHALTSQNIFYFSSISLLLTGSSYWVMRHKSELLGKRN
tara:strand:+ start:321 stop:767 length:447 start_codon:yes stop_codon:yes gene_type:complete